MALVQSSTAAVNPEVLLGRHHSVQRDAKSNQEVHVFVIAGPPVFASNEDDAKAYDFNVVIPVGPYNFILAGYIDVSTLDINATLSVRVPILGTYTLGQLNGNLETGVTLDFDVSGIVVGHVRIYVKDGWVWAEYSVTILGTKYDINIKLFPIPSS